MRCACEYFVGPQRCISCRGPSASLAASVSELEDPPRDAQYNLASSSLNSGSALVGFAGKSSVVSATLLRIGSCCGGFDAGLVRDLRNAEERGTDASRATCGETLEEGVTGVLSNTSLSVGLGVTWCVGKCGSVRRVGGVFGFETKAMHAEDLQSGRTIGIGEAEIKWMKRNKESGDVGCILAVVVEEMSPW